MKHVLERSDFTVPDGVTELTISEGCVSHIHIPETVQSLRDTRRYVDISKPLPSSITHLTFNNAYYKLTHSYFPSHLTHLTIDFLCETLNAGVLPSSLQYLKIGRTEFIEPGALPDNITQLEFTYRYRFCVQPGTLPQNLKTLISYGDLHLAENYNLPNSIEKIYIQDGHIYSNSASCFILPNNLKDFYTKYEYEQLSYVFPHNVKKITIDCSVYPIPIGVLPENLEILNFGDSYDHPFTEGVLPKGLKNLNLGKRFNRPIKIGILPDSLETITFGEYYDKPISEGVFPQGLKVIIFGDAYNQTIQKNVLPSSLKHIVFGNCFCKTLIVNGKTVLPDSVEYVDIYNDKYCIYHRAFNMNMNINIRSRETNTMINITNDIRRLLLIDLLLPQPIADPILFYLKHKCPSHIQKYEWETCSEKGFKIYSFETPYSGKRWYYTYGKIYNNNSDKNPKSRGRSLSCIGRYDSGCLYSDEIYGNGERYTYYSNDTNNDYVHHSSESEEDFDFW